MTTDELDRLAALADASDEATGGAAGLGWIKADDLYPDWDQEPAAFAAACNPDTIRSLIEAARLGVAWAEAEAALPEGAWITVGTVFDLEPGSVTVEAFYWPDGGTNSSIARAWKMPPAAALRALAAQLRERAA